MPENPLAPGFPVSEADALAARLDRCAHLLQSAIEARSRAEEDLDDFQCAEADVYRADLGNYMTHGHDVVERFRTTANRLRDDIDESLAPYRQDRQDAINRPSR